MDLRRWPKDANPRPLAEFSKLSLGSVFLNVVVSSNNALRIFTLAVDKLEYFGLSDRPSSKYSGESSMPRARSTFSSDRSISLKSPFDRRAKSVRNIIVPTRSQLYESQISQITK